MTLKPLSETSQLYPLRQLAEADEHGVLAIIVGVDGPSYRPVGATMAIFPERRLFGSLSSGCVEADISLHAEQALAANRPNLVRYGKNSPFLDISLPCGGGLDILLVPAPDQSVLSQICADLIARKDTGMTIDRETGQLAVAEGIETGWNEGKFGIAMSPELAFQVFGKGPEASTFARLAVSAGFDVTILSPDTETLDTAAEAGCKTHHLVDARYPAELSADAHTAVLLFFHDHEWEPPILKSALTFPALYIGAQGSAAARRNRNVELMAQGINADEIARIKGPIGLVPSARDARTLAVGVLAEVLATQSDTHRATR